MATDTLNQDIQPGMLAIYSRIHKSYDRQPVIARILEVKTRVKIEPLFSTVRDMKQEQSWVEAENILVVNGFKGDIPEKFFIPKKPAYKWKNRTDILNAQVDEGDIAISFDSFLPQVFKVEQVNGEALYVQGEKVVSRHVDELNLGLTEKNVKHMIVVTGLPGYNLTPAGNMRKVA